MANPRMINTKIMLRSDSAENWSNANAASATLSKGEIGIELDTMKLKIGVHPGVTWNNLPYFGVVVDSAELGTSGETAPTANLANYKYGDMYRNENLGTIWMKYGGNEGQGDVWKRIAFTADDGSLSVAYAAEAGVAGEAAKLSTARNISISGDVSGSLNDTTGSSLFDGTDKDYDIKVALPIIHPTTAANKTKISYDRRGIITGGGDLVSADITPLLGSIATYNVAAAATPLENQVPILDANKKIPKVFIPTGDKQYDIPVLEKGNSTLGLLDTKHIDTGTVTGKVVVVGSGNKIKASVLPNASSTDFGAVKISEDYTTLNPTPATDIAISQKGVNTLYKSMQASIQNLMSPIDYLGTTSSSITSSVLAQSSINDLLSGLVTDLTIPGGLRSGMAYVCTNTHTAPVYITRDGIQININGPWMYIYDGLTPGNWNPSFRFPDEILSAEDIGTAVEQMKEGLITKEMIFKLKGIEAKAEVNTVTSVNNVTPVSKNITLTTTNVGEGTNLYYTDARFDTRFKLTNSTDLQDSTYLIREPVTGAGTDTRPPLVFNGGNAGGTNG